MKESYVAISDKCNEQNNMILLYMAYVNGEDYASHFASIDQYCNETDETASRVVLSLNNTMIKMSALINRMQRFAFQMQAEIQPYTPSKAHEQIVEFTLDMDPLQYEIEETLGRIKQIETNLRTKEQHPFPLV